MSIQNPRYEYRFTLNRTFVIYIRDSVFVPRIFTHSDYEKKYAKEKKIKY